MTLPLRVTQANATAAAEHPCSPPIRAQRRVTDHVAVITPERRIRHYRHRMFLTPRQDIALDITMIEAVGDLIGDAAMTVRDAEEIIHLARAKVGYTPCADLAFRS